MAETVVALIPSRISLDMCSAIGSLIDAALGGTAWLGPGNGHDVAGKVVLDESQEERQAVALLRAATRRLRRSPVKPKPEDAVDPEDPTLTLNQIRRDDDGLTFGIGAPDDMARQMAAHFLEAFLPAFEDPAAVNYLCWAAVDKRTGQTYEISITKPDGLTPHQARQRAEAEVERLRALLPGEAPHVQ